MSLVVIAVLAVIWVVALTPMILRKISERRFTTSVDSFHRQLRGLRRAYPRLAAGVARPEMSFSTGQDGSPVIRNPVVDRNRSGYVDTIPPRSSSAEPQASPAAARSVAQAPARAASGGPRRSSTQAVRRGRVILVLIAMTLVFFLLGTIPALRVLWDASLLAFGAMAAYLALLIHFHRQAVERQMKVVDIGDHRQDSRSGTHQWHAVQPYSPAGRVKSDEAIWAGAELADEELDLLDDGRFDDEFVAGGR